MLRELLGTSTKTVLSAEDDAVCGAAYANSSPKRTNRRNGYRHRDFDTRAGTLDLAVPQDSPEFLLPRVAPRTPQARYAGTHLGGLDKRVQSLGITTLSKSQVSGMAKDLDAHVEQFRTRPLAEADPFISVAADALC